MSNKFMLSNNFFAFFVIIFSICPTSISSSIMTAMSLSTAGNFGISTYFLLFLAYFVTFVMFNSNLYLQKM